MLVLIILFVLLIGIPLGIQIYTHKILKYIGVYWGLITVARSIDGIEVESGEKRCCFKIFYNTKHKEYEVESVTDKEGCDIGSMSREYRVRKLKICLKNDGKDPNEFLDKMRLEKLGF